MEAAAFAGRSQRTEVEALLPPPLLQLLQSEGVHVVAFSEPESVCMPDLMAQIRQQGWLPLLRAAAAALAAQPGSSAHALALW